MTALSFDQLVTVTKGRLGAVDGPCPLCGPLHNPKKKVLRVWHTEPNFATWHCARCGEKGWARDAHSTARPSAEHLTELRKEAAARDAKCNAERIARALALWDESKDPRGTPAETYLNRRRLEI